jgi:hypothetical protein
MPFSTSNKVNIPELLAKSTIGPLQRRVFVLCLMTLIIDGFDVQAMGFVIPALGTGVGSRTVTVPHGPAGCQLRGAHRLAAFQPARR